MQKELGYRKLTELNLVVMQQVLNGLKSDNQRKNAKKLLVDMLDKAIDTDLLTKNVARKLNTVITKEEKKERRVLTVSEANTFLKEARGTYYYNLFVLALETGMRIGEILGLTWNDVDFNKKILHVSHTLCYFRNDGKYVFEMHDTKTNNGKRSIPLTTKALDALKSQKRQKNRILFKGQKSQDEYRDLVFVTKNNKPTQQFIVQESLDSLTKKIQQDNPEFKKVTPHCFRHTFATRAIERGMNPKTLQKILGHGSLQMTMDLYCHITEDTLYDAMRMMEVV